MSVQIVEIKKRYIGYTQGTFKHRYSNNRNSFTDEKYKHSTSLSDYVWEIKNRQGIDPILKWEVVKKCRKYRASDRDCVLCNEEKLAIASYNNKYLLNQRSEILNACRHKMNWLLYNNFFFHCSFIPWILYFFRYISW